MRKVYKIILLLLLVLGLSIGVYAAEEPLTKSIKQGTFLKVMVPEEFSTLTADIGDELWFINTQDMFLYETNAIPENTKIYGEVEDVLEPVQGRDAAIKIVINKMITPDKKVYRFKGHIYGENNNYLGGKETSAIYYRKVPHYNFNLKPYLKAAPLKILEQGRHLTVKPGEELFVIFEEDVEIK